MDFHDLLVLIPILGVAFVLYFLIVGTEPRQRTIKFQAQPYYR